MPHLHRGKPGFVACAAEPISGESGLHTLVVSAVFPAPSHLFAKMISKSRSNSLLPLDILGGKQVILRRPYLPDSAWQRLANAWLGTWEWGCGSVPGCLWAGSSCPPYCVCVEICVERGAYRRSTVLAPVTCSVALRRSSHGGILGRCALWRWRPMMWGRGGSRCVIDEALWADEQQCCRPRWWWWARGGWGARRRRRWTNNLFASSSLEEVAVLASRSSQGWTRWGDLSICGQMWSNVLGFRIMTFSY